jgi:hypothetical protein
MRSVVDQMVMQLTLEERSQLLHQRYDIACVGDIDPMLDRGPHTNTTCRRRL